MADWCFCSSLAPHLSRSVCIAPLHIELLENEILSRMPKESLCGPRSDIGDAKKPHPACSFCLFGRPCHAATATCHNHPSVSHPMVHRSCREVTALIVSRFFSRLESQESERRCLPPSCRACRSKTQEDGQMMCTLRLDASASRLPWQAGEERGARGSAVRGLENCAGCGTRKGAEERAVYERGMLIHMYVHRLCTSKIAGERDGGGMLQCQGASSAPSTRAAGRECCRCYIDTCLSKGEV